MKSELRTQQEGLSNRKTQLSWIVDRFEEQKPYYERLCDEVVYILEKRCRDHHVAVSEISSRAKELDSFLEKVQRKKYSAPFKDNKDFAGTRVVCLCKGDIARVEAILKREFRLSDVDDKLKEKSADQFGYVAKHYIAKLNPLIYGARYEGLEHLEFEVQIRTPFLNLWAEIEHRFYKHEAEVPENVRRRLKRMFAICELLDDEVNEIFREEAIAESKSRSFHETEVYALSR